MIPYFQQSILDECFEKINENKYLNLVFTNEIKEMIKKYEELWNKIRNLIRWITKSADHHGEKHMKIKFDLDNDLSLNKTIEIHNMAIYARANFHENKYYLQVFLDERLYKLWII